MVTVMVVEDEPPILNGICKLAEGFGPEIKVVCAAINGMRALRYIEAHPVDIVLSDIKMPVMSGLELAKELNARFPDTQMILISGFQEFELARTAIQYGVKDYLLKPVTKERFCEAFGAGVNRVLAKRDAEIDRQLRQSGLVGALSPAQLSEKAAGILRARYRENLSVKELAESVNCSPARLSKKFKEDFGLSISEYINEHRIGLACAMLKRDKELRIKEIALEVGFSDQYYFSKTFKKIMGIWPTEYAKELEGSV